MVVMSALHGKGVAGVHKWMKENIGEGPALYDKDLVSEHPEKFFVSEIIREHIFRRYDQELPYSVQVWHLHIPLLAALQWQGPAAASCPAPCPGACKLCLTCIKLTFLCNCMPGQGCMQSS